MTEESPETWHSLIDGSNDLRVTSRYTDMGQLEIYIRANSGTFRALGLRVLEETDGGDSFSLSPDAAGSAWFASDERTTLGATSQGIIVHRLPCPGGHSAMVEGGGVFLVCILPSPEEPAMDDEQFRDEGDLIIEGPASVLASLADVFRQMASEPQLRSIEASWIQSLFETELAMPILTLDSR